MEAKKQKSDDFLSSFFVFKIGIVKAHLFDTLGSSFGITN